MDRLRVLLRVILALTLTCPTVGFAQLKPPAIAKRAIADPTMVINDRGAKLEVLATQRATRSFDTQGRLIIHHVMRTAATSPLNSNHLGVVFNHTMQQQGYTTGEIAFMMKAGSTAPSASAAYPGLKKLTPSGLYIVLAASPSQFVSLTKQLQANPQIAWVEPIVVYGQTAKP